MEGSYLCLSLFLDFPLLLPRDHRVGWKCLQVLLLLQSNSRFILPICEMLRKELPCVSTAILLPCDLWGKTVARSEVMGPVLGLCSAEEATGGFWSSLPSDSTAMQCTVPAQAAARCCRMPGFPPAACPAVIVKSRFRLDWCGDLLLICLVTILLGKSQYPAPPPPII